MPIIPVYIFSLVNCNHSSLPSPPWGSTSFLYSVFPSSLLLCSLFSFYTYFFHSKKGTLWEPVLCHSEDTTLCLNLRTLSKLNLIVQLSGPPERVTLNYLRPFLEWREWMLHSGNLDYVCSTDSIILADLHTYVAGRF